MRIDPDRLGTRLDPRIDDPDLARSIRVPIADPLWFLVRQRQLGELAGHDGGSPALARIEGESNALATVRPGETGAPLPYDPRLSPLEAVVEGDAAVPPDPISTGLDAMRILRRTGVDATTLRALRDALAVEAPPRADTLDGRGWARLLLHAGRTVDGIALAKALASSPTPLASVPGLAESTRVEVVEALGDWSKRMDRMRRAPPPSWRSRTLDHRFSVAAPSGSAELPIATPIGGPSIPTDLVVRIADLAHGIPGRIDPREIQVAGGAAGGLAERLAGFPIPSAPGSGPSASGGGVTVLTAEGYRGNGLDWYHLRVGASAIAVATEVGRPAPPLVATRIPVRATFRGMPLPRWWSVEPHDVQFGHMEPEPEDLARLLVSQFASSYADGWVVVPFEVASGSVTRFSRVLMRDVFGREREARQQIRSEADPFSMGRLSAPVGSRDQPLLLFPTLPQHLVSDPIEETALVRDPSANLTWALERRAADPVTGRVVDRVEAELSRGAPPRPAIAPSDTPIAYRLSSGVPLNWIPLLYPPDDRPDADRTLRGGRLLNSERGHVGEPHGTLLAGDVRIHDEEVPLSGTLLRRTVQRTRWSGGGVRTWTGRIRVMRKPRDGHSGLVFDQINPTPEPIGKGAATRVSLSDVLSYTGVPRGPVSMAMREAVGERQGSVRAMILALAKRLHP